ncbi:hypothetical protein FWF48_03280 [Candidatus Saccharibacteria bacterium]|nr:hypothetical protein [Candidatus Saccharibacteria bacterium]
MKSSVEVTWHSQAQLSTAIIYLPGIVADANGNDISWVADPWLTKGDVYMVNYTGERFNSNQAISALVNLIQQCEGRGYKRIVLIGASMSGIVIYDAIDYIYRCLPQANSIIDKLQLILVDCPSSRQDFYPPTDKLALIGIPLSHVISPELNKLLQPMYRSMIAMPKRENIEAGLDYDKVCKQARDSFDQFSLAFMLDQTTYMATHKPLTASTLVGIPSVYIACVEGNDTVVQPQATSAWQKITNCKVIKIEAPHCSFGEQPTKWHIAFYKAFKELNP